MKVKYKIGSIYGPGLPISLIMKMVMLQLLFLIGQLERMKMTFIIMAI